MSSEQSDLPKLLRDNTNEFENIYICSSVQLQLNLKAGHLPKLNETSFSNWFRILLKKIFIKLWNKTIGVHGLTLHSEIRYLDSHTKPN
jgi:hypothetical protein